MQLRRSRVLVAALCGAYLAAGMTANLLPHQSRPLFSLCLVVMLSMLATVFAKMPWRAKIAAVVAATGLSLFVFFCWRQLFDPLAIIGYLPSSLEPLALIVFGAINIVVATLIVLVFSAQGITFRFRWLVFGMTGLVLLASCVMASRWAEAANSPQALLARVVMLEQTPDQNSWGERQELSTALAILGRQREAREIPLYPDAVGHELSGLPETPDSEPPFVAMPWQSAISKIAAEQRLVLIMEAHTVSEHRAWIEQTLAPFRAAGFTHYFAETIDESGLALKMRGYPTLSTGFYTRDPRFGNVVRTAIRLGFDIGGYDFGGGEFDGREEFQATALAAEFASRPDCKMVVHAGHGHVFKHEMRIVGRYMGARLWKKTGVEPFTIWQTSNELPNDVYRALIRQIGPITEPVMLSPPPQHVCEALFSESIAQPAIDAIVVHPPRLGQEPTDRRGAFADQMTRVPGVWLGNQWPVVIAAVPVGEPLNAIALDQIMLRQGESDFELWLPRTDYALYVWGLNGPLSVDANVTSTPIRVQTIPSNVSK